MVPSSTFYRHREQYFNVVTQRWQKYELTAGVALLDSSDETDEGETGETRNESETLSPRTSNYLVCVLVCQLVLQAISVVTRGACIQSSVTLRKL